MYKCDRRSYWWSVVRLFLPFLIHYIFCHFRQSHYLPFLFLVTPLSPLLFNLWQPHYLPILFLATQLSPLTLLATPLSSLTLLAIPLIPLSLMVTPLSPLSSLATPLSLLSLLEIPQSPIPFTFGNPCFTFDNLTISPFSFGNQNNSIIPVLLVRYITDICSVDIDIAQQLVRLNLCCVCTVQYNLTDSLTHYYFLHDCVL